MPDVGKPNLSARVAFTYPAYVLYQLARFSIVLATEMQAVAIGWQVYEITKRPLDLGLVALSQFLPGILLFLVSGYTADRFERRKVLTVGYAAFAICSALLLAISVHGSHTVYPIYLVSALVGIVRCFNAPASRAILPLLVPEEHFSSAFAWGATIMQIATVLGPAAGGVIYALFRGPAAVYVGAMLTAATAAVSMLGVKPQFRARPREAFSWKTVLAGMHYIWQEKLVLGSISLDMFAVLLGGAPWLLPAFARDILHTGPWGLGLLRSGQAIGGTAMAVLLAYRPLRGKVGVKMLWCVAGFGVSTILFGISHNLALSMIALILVGATDMVSVVVRGVLIQLATPNEMRGRVNAVDMIFIGTSNELGGFESGVTGQWLGIVVAVVVGGIGSLVVTAGWTALFPEIRKLDRLPTTENERRIPVPLD
jgi:MFS family permease